MTIENLKQIAIKYATTKGSRVPLAPDELCNAVVQYFNEFLKITADINTIQVAVTEEGENIVFTITGNTLDGKAFTPIVITVDHNDFVTDQEFEEFKTTTNAAIQKNTESINSLSFRVEDTENDITTIQVQVGQINTRVGNTETNIAKINSTLNNKLDKVSSTTGVPQVYVKEYNGTQTMLDLSESTRVNSIPKRGPSGRMYAEDGISSDPSSVANMRNIAAVESKIPDISNLATTEQLQEVENKIPDTSNLATKTELQEVESKIPDTTNLADVTKENTFTDVNHFTRYITTFGVEIGALEFNDDEYDVSISNATIEIFHYISGGNANSIRITDEQIWVKKYNVSDYNSFNFPNKSGTLALTSDIPDIPEYTNVDSVTYDSTNGAIIAYDGAHEIHIPLKAGDNVTIDVSEDNKKIVISAAGGGGTGDVTAAGNNTFTGVNTFTNEITFNTMKSEAGYIQFGDFNYETTEGYDYLYIDNTHINIQKFVGNNQYHEININADLMTYAPPDANVYYEYRYPRKNGTFALTSDIPDTSSFVTLAGDNTFGGTNTFNNSIYAKNGVVAGDTTNYGADSVRKGPNTYSFPNKSGTFAMTTDVIKNPIYFISFYANEPSETCHLIGTMMSKNSYGTGQKTNEEFAVMLADNLYTNSNEGLAAYGKLAKKDILCIYSDDGLSIRCLDEENSEVDLPTVMFFVMETEL